MIDERMALVFEDLNEITRQADTLKYEISGADTRLSSMLDNRDVQKDPAKLQRIASLRLMLCAACTELRTLNDAIKLFKEGHYAEV